MQKFNFFINSKRNSIFSIYFFKEKQKANPECKLIISLRILGNSVRIVYKLLKLSPKGKLFTSIMLAKWLQKLFNLDGYKNIFF